MSAYAVSPLLRRILLAVGQSGRFEAELLGAVSIVSMFTPLAYLVWVRRRRDWRREFLGILVSLYFVLRFSSRGLFHWAMWPESNWTGLEITDLFLCQVYATLGYGMWLMGYRAGLRWPASEKVGSWLFRRREPRLCGLLTIAALGVAAQFFVGLYYFSDFWLHNSWLGSIPSYFAFAGLGAMVGILACPQLKPRYRVILSLTLSILFLVPMMSTGQRGGIIQLLILFLTYMAIARPLGSTLKRRSMAILVVLFLMCLVCVYPILTEYKMSSDELLDYQGLSRLSRARDSAANAVERQSESTESGGVLRGYWTSLIDISRRIGSLDYLSLVFRYTPQRYGFQYGKTLLLIPISLVPRALWRNKPEPNLARIAYEVYVGSRRRKSHGGSMITPYGDFYINFGVPGIILGMFTLGITYRFLQAFLIGDGCEDNRFLGYILIASLSSVLCQMTTDLSMLASIVTINTGFSILLFLLIGVRPAGPRVGLRVQRRAARNLGRVGHPQRDVIRANNRERV